MSGRELLVALLAIVGLARRRHDSPDGPRVVPPGVPSPRAELAVVSLLLVATLCGVGFVVAYFVDPDTQLLGAALAGALLAIGIALVVTSRQLVVTEEVEEPYPTPHPEQQDAVTQIVAESGSRLTRRRLLGATAGLAGGALGAALIAPVFSLGPVFDASSMYATPWRRGRRLVGVDGAPLRADAIEVGSFSTAFPEGADRAQIAAAVVVVRLDPATLRPPPGREGWAPQGIVAYSKICTHANCAIALYRTPKFPPTQPGPALVCPCHYSTFDPARGAAVLFGPAGRPLPQLPLTIDAAGELRAAGTFSGPVGAAWPGVRSHPAS
jgi:ubiquinol-cytochrome c reductase iron-sulfur subunit